MTATQEKAQGSGEQDERKSDEEVLLGEDEFLGYKIRALPLADLAKIAPELRAIKDKFKAEKVTLKNLLDKWDDLLLDLLPHAEHIIEVGAGMPKEKAGALLPDQAAVCLVKIVARNWEYLKNSLSLGLGRYMVKAA